MKMKTLIKVGLWSITALLLTACASEDAQQKEETKQGGKHVIATFTGNQPKTDNQAKSRTTGTHTIGNDVHVLWTSTDHINIEDDGGTFHQSFNATFPISGNNSRANFQLATGPYSFTRINPKVLYTGFYGGTNYANIESVQVQNSPNDFSHLGKSGDCGSAIAKGGGGDYEFTLDHKASYLCFLPRCMDINLGPNIRLTKIVVTSDMNIAGQYDFSDGSLMGKTPSSGSSNTITLTLNSGNGFALDNTTADIDKNGAYMVIAPGSYNLTIVYTLKDVINGVSGNITKKLNGFVCPEGKIRDITVNLTPLTLSRSKYYMWDAKFDYWYNHLKADGTPDGNYPQNNSDPRWYHEGSGVFSATESCKDCPNVNEMLWYALKGDAHWETINVCAENGHLKQMDMAGIWLKKKTKIMADEKITEAQMKNGYPKVSPVDYRTTTISWAIPFSAPSTTPVPNTTDYFFLPAWDFYMTGWQNPIGIRGYYWSSSSHPTNSGEAYYLDFTDYLVMVTHNYGRYYGFQVRVFE